jgi:hypothetical protein
MDIILRQNLNFERKNLRKGIILGLAAIVVMFIFLWIWSAVMGWFTPVQQKEYQLVGIMGPADFGNNVEGSRNINNMLAPSANPGDGTPGSSVDHQPCERSQSDPE